MFAFLSIHRGTDDLQSLTRTVVCQIQSASKGDQKRDTDRGTLASRSCGCRLKGKREHVTERARLKGPGHKKNADTNAIVGFESKAASAPKFTQKIVEVKISAKAEGLARLQEQATPRAKATLVLGVVKTPTQHVTPTMSHSDL